MNESKNPDENCTALCLDGENEASGSAYRNKTDRRRYVDLLFLINTFQFRRNPALVDDHIKVIIKNSNELHTQTGVVLLTDELL